MTVQTSTSSVPGTVRGLLGEKLGMTQVWDAQGRLVPVTVVQASPNVVTQVRTPGEGRLRRRADRVRRDRPAQGDEALAGHFAAAGVTPRRHVTELRTADAAEYALGQEITVAAFEAGQRIDVMGTTKGKGTAGVMKRHGFKGLGASHGTQRKHRSPGSIGGCATPGRVFKGLRMAGRMGNARQTTRTSPSTRWTPSAASSWSRVRSPARAAASCSSAPRRREPDAMAGTVTEGATLTVDVVDAKGKKSGTAELPADVFDVQTNVPLIHQVVVAQLAAARQGTHSTKTRGEVSGGGKKPYKQKGTGRARQGSTRAPQFAGGGVVHGPTPRDYSQRTPKKMKAAACAARCPTARGTAACTSSAGSSTATRRRQGRPPRRSPRSRTARTCSSSSSATTR
jgi:large subunit ribosomal protein L3